MWNELIGGTWTYKAGTAGTATLPAGARILRIIAHATTAGTLVILGGDSIAIPAGADFLEINFQHLNVVANTGTSLTVVTSGTDSYYIEYVK